MTGDPNQVSSGSLSKHGRETSSTDLGTKDYDLSCCRWGVSGVPSVLGRSTKDGRT